MFRKVLLFTALGLLLVMGLSGCFSQRYQVVHNPDGSGQLMIETIFTEEYLDLFDFELTMEEAREEILEESVLSRADFPLDNPNLLSVAEDNFIHPETGALHHTLQVEIANMLEPIYYDQDDDYSTAFLIDDYGDGTYLFSAVIESLSEFIDETDMSEDANMEEIRTMMEGGVIRWQIGVNEFIEGDVFAVYDRANQIVTWEIPLYDAIFAAEPIQIFAIYRLEAPAASEPTAVVVEEEPSEDVFIFPTQASSEQSRDFLGMPNWLPIVLAAGVCLGLLALIALAAVVFFVVRKRK